jgi:hypothetical protein
VDDLLIILGVLVMIEGQAIVWLGFIYRQPTLWVFYAAVFSSLSVVWYVYMPLQHCHLSVIAFSRLARGSIIASIIRIMPSGPLRVGALHASRLFVVFYVVAIAQLIRVCQKNDEPHVIAYVPFSVSTLRTRYYPPHFVVIQSSSVHD